MGMIRVAVNGSFVGASTKGNNCAGGDENFSAMPHGHAHAVQEAIAYLVNDVLPVAINLDHELQDDGDVPKDGFRK